MAITGSPGRGARTICAASGMPAHCGGPGLRSPRRPQPPEAAPATTARGDARANTAGTPGSAWHPELAPRAGTLREGRRCAPHPPAGRDRAEEGARRLLASRAGSTGRGNKAGTEGRAKFSVSLLALGSSRPRCHHRCRPSVEPFPSPLEAPQAGEGGQTPPRPRGFGGCVRAGRCPWGHLRLPQRRGQRGTHVCGVAGEGPCTREGLVTGGMIVG